MRVLVTGGAGFIGSHLCAALLKRGDEVLCLDNLYSSRKENIASLSRDERFEFIRHDMTQPILLEVDQIYNLACPASPVHYQSNPVKTVKTNVLGTINCLGIAKRVGARFLQASTSEVYGNSTVHPQSEDYCGYVNPIGPRSCYDEGKRIAETLTLDYHRQNQVDTRIARIFNTYGPNMSMMDGRVVSNFIVQGLQGKPLTLYGDGSQTRSFCYATDMVRGLIGLMNMESFVGPVNLGNPEEIQVVDLAEQILAKTGRRSQIELRPLPPDDPVRRRPDISKAQGVLGWAPHVTLEDGLEKTIDYFRRLIEVSCTSV